MKIEKKLSKILCEQWSYDCLQFMETTVSICIIILVWHST